MRVLLRQVSMQVSSAPSELVPCCRPGPMRPVSTRAVRSAFARPGRVHGLNTPSSHAPPAQQWPWANRDPATMAPTLCVARDWPADVPGDDARSSALDWAVTEEQRSDRLSLQVRATSDIHAHDTAAIRELYRKMDMQHAYRTSAEWKAHFAT